MASIKIPAAPTDSDNDGMPDDWEKKNNLNANDASHVSKKSFYTNIELYINSIVD